MLKNREIIKLLLFISSLSAVASIVSFFISPKLFWLTIIFALTLIVSFILYTRNRYKEIEKLSTYLRQISSGDYSLDVRDNEEGELSILKNEIYKVTSMLSEHSSKLEVDKQQLTIAISDISHQIKTPLTSMMVMTELLSNPKLPDNKRKEFTTSILSQLERLNWLVTSLLTISKIDAGTVTFKKDKVHVKELIENTLESFHIPLDIKQLEVSVQGEDSTSYIGDFHWSREALTNIIKNCIEHTPDHGKITITYSENALYTNITVADNGIGISEVDLPYIFKRFYKGKHAGNDSVGIGLAMAHQMVTNQGGSIEIDSLPEEGTTFHIKFYHRTFNH